VSAPYINLSYVLSVPKIVKVGRNLTKFWQKQFGTIFFRHNVYKSNSSNYSHSNEGSGCQNASNNQMATKTCRVSTVYVANLQEVRPFVSMLQPASRWHRESLQPLVSQQPCFFNQSPSNTEQTNFNQ